MTHGSPPALETPPPAMLFTGFLLASAGALASVVVFQFGFGILPCVLCQWQRLPHALAVLLAGVGVGQARTADPIRHPFRATPWTTFTVLAGLLLLDHLANTVLAGFHIGVEQHWWAGTAACSGGAPAGLTAEQLSAQLLETPVARCDQIPWALFGVSLAGFNFILSLLLTGAAAWTTLHFNAARIGSRAVKSTR